MLITISDSRPARYFLYNLQLGFPVYPRVTSAYCGKGFYIISISLNLSQINRMRWQKKTI